MKYHFFGMDEPPLAAKILHDAGYVFSFMEDAME